MQRASVQTTRHRIPAEDTQAPLVEATAALQGAQRLVSLDVFRGVTIAAMILVNNPGSFRRVYRVLEHAPWNGCRPADLIFPFFLFIVGIAITLSFSQHENRGTPHQTLYLIILRRTLILFALGAVINGAPYFDWDVFRIPGVLQRIALCYGAAACAVLALPVAGQAGLTVLLLVAYWILTFAVPVPGYGAGNLTTDGNLAAFIDRALMAGHLLHRDWDPEGLLSTLPAIASTLFGVLAGHWLRTAQSARQRLGGLLIAGLVAVILGTVMGRWFPINKSLWSSSYAVVTAGAAMISLGACYWLVDLEGMSSWSIPFVIYGTNPITVYFGSSLAEKALEFLLVTGPDGAKMPIKRYVFEAVFLPIAAPKTASLLYAVVTVLIWFGIAALLYRRRIFIKV
jgi:predicted acyltransferase